jgi:TonB family protein
MQRRGLNHFIGASILLLFAPVLIGQFLGQAHAFDESTHKNWSCLKRRDLLRDSRGLPVWLNSSELMDRVIEKRSIVRPASLGKNSLRGTVRIRVLIDKTGRVICAQRLKGHPLGVSAAIKSLQAWSFRPFIVNGQLKSVAGVLTLTFDFGA